MKLSVAGPTVIPMTDESDLERRVTNLERQMARAADDARTARRLAAATDRDRTEVMSRIDANRVAIIALGEQTAGGFGEVARRFDANRGAINALGEQTAGGFREVNRRIDGLDHRIDGLASEMRAGFEAIGQRLDTLINRAAGE
jgi:hypothetical protein